MSEQKPIVGISMGDPAGIGPEIIAAAMARPRVRELGRPVVVGDASVMRQATRFAGVSLDVHSIAKVSDAMFRPDTIDVLDLNNVDVAKLELGKVSDAAGNAAFEAVKTMIELAMARQIDATVTAPIHKEALVAAGHHFPGHTEIFAHFTGTRDYTMML